MHALVIGDGCSNSSSAHCAELGVPVIVMTGDDSPQSRALPYDHGASANLGKQVDETILLDAINPATGH